MPSAFVQEIGAASDGSSGTTVGWTGSKTVTAGNTLVCYFVGDTPATFTSIADNLGTITWSLDFDQSYALHSLKLMIVRGVIVTGGTLTSVTVTTGTTTGRVIGIAEFSDVSSPSGYDSRTGTSASPNSDVDFNAVDGIELWTAAAADGTNNLGTFTPPTGYTKVFATEPSIPNGGIAAYRAILAAYRVGAASGTVTASAGASTMDWLASTALLIAPITRPALAGISFDGVTVR